MDITTQNLASALAKWATTALFAAAALSELAIATGVVLAQASIFAYCAGRYARMLYEARKAGTATTIPSSMLLVHAPVAVAALPYREDLSQFTLRQLRQLAKAKGVRNWARMNKAALIAALS